MNENFSFDLGFDDPYMPEEYEGEIYHYTPYNAYHSILYGDPDDITLWASQYDCLNDLTEGQITIQRYLSVCEELSTAKKISQDFYEMLIKLSPKEKRMLTQFVDGVYHMKDFHCDSYVCSFSKNRDAKTMWGYYMKGNRGVNIGFDSGALRREIQDKMYGQEIEGHLYEVIYEENQQKQVIEKFLMDLYSHCKEERLTDEEINYLISEQLTKWRLIFKHPDFKDEEEVRIIMEVAKEIPSQELASKQYEILHRTHNGCDIPYIELKLGKECLTSVCIGPPQCSDVKKQQNKSQIINELQNHNYETDDVIYTEVPLRY